jgi:hypothetical protein
VPLILVWIFVLIGALLTYLSRLQTNFEFDESELLGFSFVWFYVGSPVVLLALVTTMVLLTNARKEIRISGINPPGYWMVVTAATLAPITLSTGTILLLLSLNLVIYIAIAFLALVSIMILFAEARAPLRSVITPTYYRLMLTVAVLSFLTLSASVILAFVIFMLTIGP